MATAAILIFVNPPKDATHYGGYSYKVSWSLMIGIQNLLNENKLLKIQKWKDFNGNGYLQGVRHASPYGDHVGFLWWPPKYKNIPIWGNFGLQVDYVLANWYPSSFFTTSHCIWYSYKVS
jgi:hypothetical protein